jgi:GLPGLI family protein
MVKEKLPEFKIVYYSLSFADNKSIYKFSHWDENNKIPEWMKEGQEDNNWYFDFSSGLFTQRKLIEGSSFVITDTTPPIEWKITNENRMIAGFNCRKAVGKIMDSVYVFAFYTDEIAISAGPCSVNGLPGMILGLSIPRLYTSYIATKVSLAVNEADIKPVVSKKYYSRSSFRSYIEEKSAEWFSWGDDKEENLRQKNLFLWNIYL